MKNPPKHARPSLPNWANSWVINRKTGELKPAFYDLENCEWRDQDDQLYGVEWDGFIPHYRWIVAGLVVGLLGIALLLYFSL